MIRDRAPNQSLVAVVAFVSASAAAGVPHEASISRLQASALRQPLQLAPNPACPNKAPYCRTQLPFNVMGFHEGALYGWTSVLPGVSCPDSNFPPNDKAVDFCFYASTTFAPENWIYLGQFPTTNIT